MVDSPAEEPLTIAVHQATGMIAVQADCDMSEAFSRLTIRATATDQTLHDTALDVLDGIARFD